VGAACLSDQPGERKSVIFKVLVLLTALMQQKASDFQWIITGDESWFFLCCPRDSVWVASRDEFPQHIKHKIAWESAWFQSFGRLRESSVFLMHPKRSRTTSRSSLMLLCPVWLRIFGHGLVGRHWKVGWSTSAMHVLTF
jgi:hypothetical protein